MKITLYTQNNWLGGNFYKKTKKHFGVNGIGDKCVLWLYCHIFKSTLIDYLMKTKKLNIYKFSDLFVI